MMPIDCQIEINSVITEIQAYKIRGKGYYHKKLSLMILSSNPQLLSNIAFFHQKCIKIEHIRDILLSSP